MARRTATYIHCDGPKCKVFFEAEKDSGMTPEGWYRITKDMGGKMDSWEFHDSSCVAKWARLRSAALEGKQIATRSSPARDRTNADKQLEDALEAFSLDSSADLTVTQVSEYTGMDKSSAQRRVQELVAAGNIFETEPRRGPFGAKYRINS